MGTRHLIAVINENEVKVAQYGQWDGYLTGQGNDICNFIMDNLLDSDKLKQFKSNVKKCSWITDDEFNKQKLEYGFNPEQEFVSLNDVAYNNYQEAHPEHDRATGADILKMIMEKEYKLVNSFSFGTDSLFCEYAYVIDLDNEVLETYIGFNVTPTDNSNRFGTEMKDNYYPVQLYSTLPFKEITGNTMSELEQKHNRECNPEDYEDEDEEPIDENYLKEQKAEKIYNDVVIAIIHSGGQQMLDRLSDKDILNEINDIAYEIAFKD